MRFTKLIGLLIVALYACGFTGCTEQQNNPARNYGAALDTFNALQITFNTAAKNNLLTDEQIVATKPLWEAGDRQIDILRRYWNQESPAAIAAYDSLMNIIESIRQWMAITQRKE